MKLTTNIKRSMYLIEYARYFRRNENGRENGFELQKAYEFANLSKHKDSREINLWLRPIQHSNDFLIFDSPRLICRFTAYFLAHSCYALIVNEFHLPI